MIYLASPYTHPNPKVREARAADAARVSAILMKGSRHVCSPIAHTHAIAVAGGLLKGWEFWKPYDTWFIKRVDEVWVLMIDGWRESRGVTEEIGMARELGKPLRFVDAEGRFADA